MKDYKRSKTALMMETTMIATAHLRTIAKAVREKLEMGNVNRQLLAKLYDAYADVGDVKRFVERALAMFPKLGCGIASVYLKRRLGEGTICRGKYESHRHTFLLVDAHTVVDITADQYGGPRIYVGPLRVPWSRRV